MAAIQNERDKILQAAAVRVEPVPIPMDQIEGLTDKLGEIDESIDDLGVEVANLMNTSMDLIIRASSLNASSGDTITLTAVRKNGITGAVTWSLFAGSAVLTPSGETCTIAGSSITSASITVRAAIGTKEAFATINKVGSLALQNSVNLATQVTGALANSNVSGLGALALLNTVNLNTQTTGALNGLTQVTNLGDLAYANAIAANQIGAGTLAAGVIYAGAINANNITSGTLSGIRIQSGEYLGIGGYDVNTSSSWFISSLVKIKPTGICTIGVGVNEILFTSSDLAIRTNSKIFLQQGSSSGNNFGEFTQSGSHLYGSSAAATLTLTNNGGPALCLTPSTNIGTSQPNGTIVFHPTHGLMFVKDGVMYICSTTPLP